MGRREDEEVNVALLKPFQVLWVGSPRAASIVAIHELLVREEGWKYNSVIFAICISS